MDAYAGATLLKQKKLSEFVDWHVYGCMTYLVEYILRKSNEDSDAPFTWDDVTNMYTDNRGEIAELEEEIEELDDRLDSLMGVRIHLKDDADVIKSLEELRDQLENKIIELEDEQDTPQEIFEWWHVSGQLRYWLEKKGEPVLSDDNLWGRTCSGQAIFLDGVIEEIYNEIMGDERTS